MCIRDRVDHGRVTTGIDPVFGLIPGAHPGHWASTTLASDGRMAWQVAFGGGIGGHVVPILVGNDRLTVRAVRTAR